MFKYRFGRPDEGSKVPGTRGDNKGHLSSGKIKIF